MTQKVWRFGGFAHIHMHVLDSTKSTAHKIPALFTRNPRTYNLHEKKPRRRQLWRIMQSNGVSLSRSLSNTQASRSLKRSRHSDARTLARTACGTFSAQNSSRNNEPLFSLSISHSLSLSLVFDWACREQEKDREKWHTEKQNAPQWKTAGTRAPKFYTAAEYLARNKR